MAFAFNILVLITSSHNLTFNNGCLQQAEPQKMEGSALTATRAHASSLLLSDYSSSRCKAERSGRRARPALATPQPTAAAAQAQAWLTWEAGALLLCQLPLLQHGAPQALSSAP